MNAQHSILHPSPTWTRRVLWANLVGQVTIVVTGGAVRLTGSGLGCSTWPECEPGQFTPIPHAATSIHPYIEFGNRTITGVLVVLAVAALWVVWRGPRRSRGMRALATVPLVGVLAQAVIGGLTVLVKLNPALVGSHFLISMVLVSASTALALRAGRPDTPPRWAVGGRTRALAVALVPLAAAVLVLGTVVTGAGPHSGDATRPSRYALDPVTVARVHSLSVWAYVAVLVTLALVLRRLRRRGGSDPALGGALRRTGDLLVISVVQGAIGYLQYLTGLPGALVGLHMLGASLMVVAQTAQLLALRPRTPAPSGAPDRPGAPAAAAA
ncbi:COX15/CtaA family protein [Isoptericola sp. b441]|uniref:COX15/CtaA family protein n=1 Tax=Actinotalea lenta TaxID=3064654 RepID=A0ABT9D9C0_9CELL|nr:MULTISPECIES: COX15/CtaA family protein [unclassified Isoptericola]MDO8107490.1 COX15/CtaA family protein [Isoptericola sp. b441]MDO8120850.1 COX15/CtaA family protein [Isoptericola sp. b490]